jgi:hypothetical protein
MPVGRQRVSTPSWRGKRWTGSCRRMPSDRIRFAVGGQAAPVLRERAASTIISAVSSACETPTAWDAPGISRVRFAFARSAMIRWAPTGMFRSWSPKMNQLGTCFQSGSFLEGSDSAAW